MNDLGTSSATFHPRAKGGGSDWITWAVLFGFLSLGVGGAFGLIPMPAATRTASTRPGRPASAPSLPVEPPAARGAAAGVAPVTAPDTVGARHLLVQYAGAWRAAPEVTLTKDQAKARAEEARGRLRQGADFAKVMAEYGNSGEIAAKNGVLGRLTRESGMPSVTNAAFALAVGEYSPVVETPFGFHVIQRTP
jgi:peptidyl-prolyl cis-trans isomerase NIMA-interacting 1